jgi:hypothetical protein
MSLPRLTYPNPRTPALASMLTPLPNVARHSSITIPCENLAISIRYYDLPMMWIHCYVRAWA